MHVDVNIKLNSDKAKIPQYKTIGSSGMDVSSIEEYTLKPGEVKAISTGLSFSMPPGMEIQVRPRSGLALKNKITVLNTPGTCDADYRGILMVILINHGTEDFKIEVGDRIAQIVLCQVDRAIFKVVDELEQTDRGAGGFGSTGIK